jgi:phenazine biosynthesis protein phzE
MDAAALVARMVASGGGGGGADREGFAVLRRRGAGGGAGAGDAVEVLFGPVREEARLAEIALPEGAPGAGGAADALALVPFRQIRERGFDVRDDGTPLSVLYPREAYEVPLAEFAAALPTHDVTVVGGAFDVPDDVYAEIVGRVVRDEIGRGEGANFVVRRTFQGEIPGFAPRDGLALFRRLLAGERGAYWTYLVRVPGGRTLVGASPEAHVRMAGGTVVMNPISGTYRYPAGGPDLDGLLAFLRDAKEVEELTMVVDEELKMMCTVGDLGGVVVGPRLKEMAHLAHTEYELRGRSTMDVREVLRETMFAATVTGSPVQNACRVIERHEVGGRGYYAGALALIGRDPGGARTLDSPILIRTADIAGDGRLRVPVGATLVRHSDPASEVAETHAKAAGVLTALGVLEKAAPAPVREGGEVGAMGAAGAAVRLADDPRVREALDSRRAGLAPFWLRMREPVRGSGDAPTGSAVDGGTVGGIAVDGGDGLAVLSGHAYVVDGEDTFTAMLAHVLRCCGLAVTVRRFDAPGLRDEVLAHPGPVVLGPGPGDPADHADPKMRALRALARDLLGLDTAGAAAGRPGRVHAGGVLGVCLGHELIAAELGLPLARKAVPFQGAQERVRLFEAGEHTVGFYNTFTARADAELAERLRADHGVELARDPATGDVHALRLPGVAGVQFHPESVLTLDGPRVVAALLGGAMRGAAAGVSTGA